MYQITNNTGHGILYGLAGDGLEKQAFIGGIASGIARVLGGGLSLAGKGLKGGWWLGKTLAKPVTKPVGWLGKKLGITPAGMGITSLMAAPVGASAIQSTMPPGGIKQAIWGKSGRATLGSPVKSPQDPLF